MVVSMVVEIKQTLTKNTINYTVLGEIFDETIIENVNKHGGASLKGEDPNNYYYYIDVNDYIEKYDNQTDIGDNAEKLLLCLKQYLRDNNIDKLL